MERRLYTKYGVAEKIIHGEGRPLCMFCDAVFYNFNLKQSKLDKHFQARHSRNRRAENDNSLKTKKACYDIKEMLPKLGIALMSKVLSVLYKVLCKVTKVKKLHTVVETFIIIKPCAFNIAEGIVALKQLQQFPLSNNIIQNTTDDIGTNILERVVSDNKASSAKILVRLD